MRFIDGKGRLFGKLNVIDFLVILLLICLSPMFYYGYRLLKKPEPLPKKLIDVELDYKFIEIKPEILKLITVGDKEIDERGEVIGEIVKIGKSTPYQHILNVGNSKGDFIINIEDRELIEIPTTLKLNAEIKDNNLYYKNEQIVLNSPIDFKTSQYTAIAVPFKKVEEPKERWVEIRVKFTEVFPELANIVTVGDTEKDSAGRTRGTLTTIISNQSSSALTLLRDKFIKVPYPSHRDIIVLFNLLCIERSGTLYFKNYPVKIGNTITFTTDSYSLTGIIVSLDIT